MAIRKPRLSKHGKPLGRPSKVWPDQELEAAVTGCMGSFSVVAYRLGCCWDLARDRVNENPKIKKLFEAEEQKLCALAVSGLIKAANNGERWAIERLLETKAAGNGFKIVQHVKTDVTSNGQTISQPPPVIEFIDLGAPPRAETENPENGNSEE
jgi:hypothetical protein